MHEAMENVNKTFRKQNIHIKSTAIYQQLEAVI